MHTLKFSIGGIVHAGVSINAYTRGTKCPDSVKSIMGRKILCKNFKKLYLFYVLNGVFGHVQEKYCQHFLTTRGDKIIVFLRTVLVSMGVLRICRSYGNLIPEISYLKGKISCVVSLFQIKYYYFHYFFSMILGNIFLEVLVC